VTVLPGIYFAFARGEEADPAPDTAPAGDDTVGSFRTMLRDLRESMEDARGETAAARADPDDELGELNSSLARQEEHIARIIQRLETIETFMESDAWKKLEQGASQGTPNEVSDDVPPPPAPAD
jgi:hypothetical protein